MNTLLLLKSLKILKKFKKFFLSLNGDRALPRMNQNVVLDSFESIFNALSTKSGHFLWCVMVLRQGPTIWTFSGRIYASFGV